MLRQPLCRQALIGLNRRRPMIATRQLGFFKILARATKVPAYVGGTFAAGGSYVAYKAEQASNYANDKLAGIRDFTEGIFDKTGDFLKGFREGKSEGGGEGGDGGDGGEVALAAAAAMGLSPEDEENTEQEEEEEEEELIEDDDDFDEEAVSETDNEMLSLTRQMIEIRNLLASINHDTIKLPSIVVIGSQSSGKSSVLESIAGQEFLPKGSNMVTRRPIELTLVNTPDSAADVAEFPALKMSNLTDFEQVQKILFDLNMAVPPHECISNDPIQITIRSPRVPDLSLVDLPGYIQVEAADQPVELKQKIRQLCSRYLESPNIILAISAADVDLANSAALRASRQADPRGERTIGVVTKLDLVSPEAATAILTNKKYPLRMGYVGVITKAPSSMVGNKGLFASKKRLSSYQSFIQQQNFEHNYLKEHRDEFQGTTTGTRNMKKKLMKVLEKSMAASLRPTHFAIQQELEETTYQFKVEFNDRALTPQMYVASNVDALKLATKELAHGFSRRELKALLKNQLDQRVLDLLAERYWSQGPNEPPLKELSQIKDMSSDVYWHKKLDLATNSFTKLGVGRISTSMVTNTLLTEVENLVNGTQLRNHTLARNAVRDAAKVVLGAKYYSTADQVENCIKPYKYEIELEDREWTASRENSAALLKEEMRQCEEAYSSLKKQVGGRKLSQVMTYLEKSATKDVDYSSNETLGFSPNLVQAGRDALFLKNRLSLLKMRHSFVRGSKKCATKEGKYQCPEIFLDAVATKVTSTAVLFLNVELLSDFYYNFPRELDNKLLNLSKEEIERFAKEDPKIKKHIELQERKELLEDALGRVETVLKSQGSKINRLEREEGKSLFGW